MEWTGDKLQLSSGTVIVDFYAKWCGPCKTIGPVFAELAQEASDAGSMVTFLKIDVDKHEGVVAKYEVESMPTFLVLKDGKVQERLEGADKVKLQKMVRGRTRTDSQI